MQKITRNYTYALLPTPTQLQLLENVGIKSRILWNKLVGLTRFAIQECQHGRRVSIVNEYIRIFEGKKMAGRRVSEVNKLAEQENISPEQALKLFLAKRIEKDISIKRRKDGTRYLRFSNIHLARLYAGEKVNILKNHMLKNGTFAIGHSILRHWEDFCKAWEKGLFKAPRFKKYGQTSAIQKQITATSSFTFGKYVDLSWCGSPCLSQVEVGDDRPLPENSTIKQISLKKNSVGKWYITCTIEADKSAFARNFGPPTEKIVGIDPGMKSALTTSDGEKLTPQSLSRDNRLEKKLKRLQRKIDRQLRQGNPHCFNKNGTWKRGNKINFRSKKLLNNVKQIAKIKLHFKDAKADFYHKSSIKLLQKYDVIGIGNVKLHSLAKGQGKQKRSFNLKSREHAISDFKNKIKDKANLSLTPKTICVINEAYTTKTCNKCKHMDNSINLDTRIWTCPKCNTKHDRDVNAAINIKNKTISEQMAAA